MRAHSEVREPSEGTDCAAPGRSGKAGRAPLRPSGQPRAEVTRAPGTTWTTRGPERGCALSAKDARGARCAGSRARNCPAAAEIAPQMGRSCALTGLNWKRSEPVILKAGGNAGSLFARHVPPADPGRPSAAVRPATRTLAARLPAHRASPGAPGHRGGGRRPGLAPVSPRARCVSVSSSAQLESFTFFSHLSSFSFFSALLRRPFILSFYLLLLSSSFPFSSDPLRSISACFSFFPLFCSFFIYSFPFCPARRLPGPPVLAPSPPSLCSISLALFSGRCAHSSVFFPRISLLTPSPSPDSSRR